MDIKITDKALRYFLETSSSPEEIAREVSLCGPTFDRISKQGSDYLYEVEIITNRIDTASAQGIARDSVAILNQLGIKSTLKNDPYQEKINLYPHYPKSIHLEIADNTLVPRFTAITLEKITVKDSPQETQNLLNLCGERPINNVVDITNEITLLYGMPCHVFDQDKLATQKLIIRESKRGEEIVTLDSKRNMLHGGEIVIEDGAGRLVDLCGIMGGQIAEVDQYTKNILLIVPVYHPKKIRRASLLLQKRTLAAQIYEKQPDTELCLPTLMAAIKLFKERAGAVVNSTVFDSNSSVSKAKTIPLDISWANNLIGQEIPPETVISILKSLGFSVTVDSNSTLQCKVPSWRKFDINIKEDLVEEVARVYGYSKLPPILPCVNLAPEPRDPLLKTESIIKDYLSCQGFNEIYNNSLVSLEQIEKSQLKEQNHLKLTNALSKDYEYLRTTLVPSILQNTKNNQGRVNDDIRIFELSNVYLPEKDTLPEEISKLVILTTLGFRQTKGILDSLFKHLNLRSYKYKSSTLNPPYYLDEETAKISAGNSVIGFLGTIKPVILHHFGITLSPTVIELDTAAISKSVNDRYIFQPISDYPEVVESMTITSDKKIGDIIDEIYQSNNHIKNIQYTESFKNNHSFKIFFSSFEKNLTQVEVNEIKTEIQKLFN